MRSTLGRIGMGLAVLGIGIATWGVARSGAEERASLTGHVSLEGRAARVRATDVIVSLEGLRETTPARAAAVLDQKNLIFIPHVLPVLAGSPVNLRNSDPLLHSIKTISTANPSFNRSSMRGTSETVVFRRPENITVGCSVHSEMRAYILVKENPYFARLDARGNYAIRSVPAGDYTLRVWTERTGNVDQRISVAGSENVVTNVTVK